MSPQHTVSKLSSPSRQHSIWWVPSILLAITVVASPLLIGGVHASTAALVSVLALVGLWWALWSEPTTEGGTTPIALSIPTLAFALMAIFCMVQLLPLPSFLYAILQPTAYAHLVANWEAAYGVDPAGGWHLLSVDPRATTGHALKWIALSATAALAGQLMGAKKQRRRWLAIILATGAIVATLGAIQHLSGTEAILGVYDAEITARSIGPFVNSNHAASYYALMAILGGAYALDHLRRSPGKASLGAGVSMAAIFLCAAHGSDGANLALACGLLILGIHVVVRTPSNSEAKTGNLLRAGVIVFLVAAVASFFVPDQWTVAEEEPYWGYSSAEARLKMMGSALEAAADYPLVGSGAGSVDRAMPPYVDWHRFGNTSIPTVENEPAEWLMTLGPGVTLIAFAIFIFLLLRTAPHIWKKRGRRGAAYSFAIIVCLFVISLFHFPFFTLGISVVAVVALEACLDRERDGLHLKACRKKAYFFALALTLALCGLMAARATVLVSGPEDHLQVDDEEAVNRALRLYPTDGVLLSAVSLKARQEGDFQRALDLSRRAFELRPHPQQEYLLARGLALNGEYEEAAEVYASLMGGDRRRLGMYDRLLVRVRQDLSEPQLRARAMAPAQVQHWRRFGRQLEEREGSVAAIEFALALVEEHPRRAEAHLELIDIYRRADQAELAEMYARSLVYLDLEDADGERPAGLLVLLDILRRQGRSLEGRSIAFRALSAGYDSEQLARQILLLRPEYPRELTKRDRSLMDRAMALGCTPPYERGHRRQCWEADAYLAEADGDLERAQTLLGRVEHVIDDPRPLGQFLARHGRCQDLAGLQRRHRDGRYESALTRLAQQCARHRD